MTDKSSTEMVKNVFDWDHFLCYLSGPIDFDPTGGRDWRTEWTEKLVEIGFKKHQILNPCKKPLKGAQFNLDDESNIMAKHRSQKAWKELCHVMSQIVRVDLRLVDKSDIILVNMPCFSHKNFEQISGDFEKNYEMLSRADPDNDILHNINASFQQLLSKSSGIRIPTYGTIHEIVIARQQHKPVYMVWEGGKETCSAWLLYLIGHENVFGTFDEVLTRLNNVSKGRTAYNARDWLLLDLEPNDHDTD